MVCYRKREKMVRVIRSRSDDNVRLEVSAGLKTSMGWLVASLYNPDDYSYAPPFISFNISSILISLNNFFRSLV